LSIVNLYGITVEEQLAGEVDLLYFRVKSIVMLEADVITNVSRATSTGKGAGLHPVYSRLAMTYFDLKLNWRKIQRYKTI